MKTDSFAMSRRTLLGTLGVITAGVALSACGDDSSTGGSGTGGKPVAGGALVLGLPALSDYLNPLVATTNSLAWVTDPVVETLYTYDEEMRSVPLLAAGEPTISEDGLTWTIEVAKGVTFSNGEPLTAEDVAAVINHVSDPSAYTDWTSYFAYFVSGAKAKGPRTVVISLAMPYGVLRSHLSNLPIIHRDSLKKNDTTIGTGPYAIDKVTQGQTVLLRRNDGYHGTPGGPDTLEFRAIPDAGTRLVNLREGKIHVMTDVPASNVATLEKDDSLTVEVVDAPISILTFFNATKAPFDDVRVRQALAHAMDREGVAELVYAGTAVPAQGPAGPALEAHDPDLELYSATPDVERAKELLAEAGVADGVEFTLTISSSSEATVKMAEVLAQGWAKAGITCRLETTDAGTWITRWMEGDYQLSMTTYVTGVSAGASAFPLFTSYASSNTMNFGYSSKEADALMSQAWATTDESERAELTRKVDRILAEDAVAVPPVYPRMIVAQRRDVTGLDAGQLAVGRIDAAALRRLA
ncbi:ABC transporter substrate-binding protein [Nocardioides sp. zg-DK7169]|uniref:ABC transporter substrate-binding protein n=1 Tax=Nocardioides sp. zg-DK7169 TaxID=2736600 RepID=UPI0015529B76|nr:ABC transporter substrate-binding protein [Nocardioides sp. zg-DK7169]NPC97638.1 ABC transporter substrate-binding protein [Nocardioides sp. zg-DK7169]